MKPPAGPDAPDAAEPAESPAGQGAGPRAWIRQRAGAILVAVALLVLWEAGVRLLGIKEYLLPRRPGSGPNSPSAPAR